MSAKSSKNIPKRVSFELFADAGAKDTGPELGPSLINISVSGYFSSPIWRARALSLCTMYEVVPLEGLMTCCLSPFSRSPHADGSDCGMQRIGPVPNFRTTSLQKQKGAAVPRRARI